MNCDYVLITAQSNNPDSVKKFHASTPEEAESRARDLVRAEQSLATREFPFCPPIVKGRLFREIAEIDGAEFIRIAEPQSL